MEAVYTRNCEIRPDREFPPGMHRIALGVEYNGAAFHGFQAQKFAVETVQGNLERALSRIADEPITLTCAGRTDAGVHACEQVLHFDTLSGRPLKAWSLGVNAHLPVGISVCWAREIGPGFHARFSALSRRYRYVILNRDTRPALLSDQITWFKRPLSVQAMAEAAHCLVGERNFNALRAAQCQARNPVRQIHHLAIAECRDLIAIDIKANAFLYHMVRNIIGCLLAIGAGDKPVTWMQEVLDSQDRTKAAATASARGLYLVKVEYPEQFSLADVSQSEDSLSKETSAKEMSVREIVGPLLLPDNLDWQYC